MNWFHRWYCRSEGWRRRLQGTLLPALLRHAELGPNVAITISYIFRRPLLLPQRRGSFSRICNASMLTP